MRTLILSIIVIITSSLSAQTLRVELPFYAGKEVKLSARRAIGSDTLLIATLDNNGVAIFDFANKQPRIGLASIHILPDVNYEFVLSPNENVTIRSTEQYVNPSNTIVKNSIENTMIDSLFKQFMLFKHQKELLFPLPQLYAETDNFRITVEKEQKRIEFEIEKFNKNLKTSPYYAVKFIEARQIIDKLEFAMQYDSLKSEVRKYMLNQLDVSFIYGSGMYFNFFNGLCMYVYYNESKYHKEFGNDMVQILKKVEPIEIFTTLATDLLTICEKLAWDAEAEKIVDYLIASKRITNPKGKFKLFITQHAIRVGKSAPELVVANSVIPAKEISFNKAPKGTLIIFYETGCGHCETELKKLIDNYKNYQEKGIQIVTISADHDKTIFENNARNFPWTYKLCDLKAISGQNFQNYGVIGTPTMYLVNKKGIIQMRTAKLEDILSYKL